MANLFNSIRVRAPKHNQFNLSHDVKLTAKFGVLTPILCQDVLPGDVFKCNTEALVRFAPMLAPVMHRVNVYSHFYFVPKRLLWVLYKDFITGGEDGLSSPSYPRIRITKAMDADLWRPGSLADYLGFPVMNRTNGFNPNFKQYDIDALPFRAYALIWNEYYRDQNIMDEIDIMKDHSGPIASADAYNLMKLRLRCWQKDYFTSALPWAQRGQDVHLPLHGKAGFVNSLSTGVDVYGDGIDRLVMGKGYPVNSDPVDISSNSSGDLNRKLGNYLSNESIKEGGVKVKLYNSQLLSLTGGIDLSSASAATINELRRAIKAQEFLEVAARGGSRYIEQIYSYFGVRSSDARLQRPEFIGGGKSPVVISDVLQTSQTTESSAQATPAGHAVSFQKSHSFKYRAEEHGYIIGIMSIMPRSAYQQGLPRMFSKFDRLDHYWPQFAHLGEQEIKNQEIYLDLSQGPENMNNEGTFGYTPRYAEYKHAFDTVHGDFRDTLAFWHMGRIFDGEPGLNEEFLSSVQPSANRVFAVQDDAYDKIWINIHHNIKALRLMPKYGTPLF